MSAEVAAPRRSRCPERYRPFFDVKVVHFEQTHLDNARQDLLC